MKNIFCLFERPFEIQKNGVIFFEIFFSFACSFYLLLYCNHPNTITPVQLLFGIFVFHLY